MSAIRSSIFPIFDSVVSDFADRSSSISACLSCSLLNVSRLCVWSILVYKTKAQHSLWYDLSRRQTDIGEQCVRKDNQGFLFVRLTKFLDFSSKFPGIFHYYHSDFQVVLKIKTSNLEEFYYNKNWYFLQYNNVMPSSMIFTKYHKIPVVFLGFPEILWLFKVAGRVGTWVTFSHGLLLDVLKIMGISSSAGSSTNGPIFNHYLEISKMVTFTNRPRCGFTFNINENWANIQPKHVHLWPLEPLMQALFVFLFAVSNLVN